MSATEKWEDGTPMRVLLTAPTSAFSLKDDPIPIPAYSQDQPVALSFWMRKRTATRDWVNVLQWGNSPEEMLPSIDFNDATDSLRVTFQAREMQHDVLQLPPGQSIPELAWVHVAVSFSRGGASLFLDGERVVTREFRNDYSLGLARTLHFATMYDPSVDLADLRLLYADLSDEQVRTLAQEGQALPAYPSAQMLQLEPRSLFDLKDAELPPAKTVRLNNSCLSLWLRKFQSVPFWRNVLEVGRGQDIQFSLYTHDRQAPLRVMLPVGKKKLVPWSVDVQLPLRDWAHLAVCLRDNEAAVYLNGVQVGTRTFDENIAGRWSQPMHFATLGDPSMQIAYARWFEESLYPDQVARLAADRPALPTQVPAEWQNTAAAMLPPAAAAVADLVRGAVGSAATQEEADLRMLGPGAGGVTGSAPAADVVLDAMQVWDRAGGKKTVLTHGSVLAAGGGMEAQFVYEGGKPSVLAGPAVRLPGGQNGSSSLRLQCRVGGQFTGRWNLSHLVTSGATFFFVANLDADVPTPYPRLLQIAADAGRFPSLQLRTESPGTDELVAGLWADATTKVAETARVPTVFDHRTLVALRVRNQGGQSALSVWTDPEQDAAEVRGPLRSLDLSQMGVFCLGRSLMPGDADLGMDLHEFRYYRQALGDAQVRDVLKELADKWADDLVLTDARRGVTRAPAADPDAVGAVAGAVAAGAGAAGDADSDAAAAVLSVPLLTGPDSQGHLVAASSVYSADRAPYLVFDRRRDSVWMSGPEGARLPQWVQVRLAQPLVVSQYSLVSGPTDDGVARAPKSWELQASLDGVGWRALDSVSGNVFQKPLQKRVFRVAEPGPALYVRLLVKETLRSSQDGAPDELVAVGGFNVSGKALPGAPVYDAVDMKANESSGQIAVASSTAAGSQPFFALSGDGRAWTSGTNPAQVATWLALQLPEAGSLLFYTLTADAKERSPTRWAVEASNDGDRWQAVDRREGVRFASDGATRSFCVRALRPYLLYRITVGGVQQDGAPVALRGFRLRVLGPLPAGAAGGCDAGSGAPALGRPELAFRASSLGDGGGQLQVTQGGSIPLSGSWQSRMDYVGSAPAQLVNQGLPALQLPGGRKGSSGLYLYARAQGQLSRDWDLGDVLENGMTLLVSARVRSLPAAGAGGQALFALGSANDVLALSLADRGALSLRASSPDFSYHAECLTQDGVVAAGEPQTFAFRIAPMAGGQLELLVRAAKGSAKVVRNPPRWAGAVLQGAWLGTSKGAGVPDLPMDLFEFRWFRTALGDDLLDKHFTDMSGALGAFEPAVAVESGRVYEPAPVRDGAVAYGRLQRRLRTADPQDPADSADDLERLLGGIESVEPTAVTSLALPAQDDLLVEFQGVLRVDAPGAHSFRILGDGVASVALYASDQWRPVAAGQPSGALPGTIQLAPGVYPLRVRWRSRASGRGLQVQWQPPGSAGFADLPFASLGVRAGGPVAGGLLVLDQPQDALDLRGVAVPGSKLALPPQGGNHSVAFWARRSGLPQQFANVFIWGDEASTLRMPAYYVGPGNAYYYRLKTSASPDEGGNFSAVPPVLNQWHHIAFVYQGPTLRLYIDGRETAQARLAGNPVFNAAYPLRFCASGPDPQMRLAKLRLFPRDLRLDEVQALADEDPAVAAGADLARPYLEAAQLGRVNDKAKETEQKRDAALTESLRKGMLLQYAFEEQGGDWTKDHTGQQRHGYVLGAPRWGPDAALELRAPGDGVLLREPIRSPRASVSFWFEMQPGRNDWCALLTCQGGAAHPLVVHPQTLKAGFWWQDGPAGSYRENGFHYTTQGSEAKLQLGKMTHVAVVMDGSVYRLYLDGRKAMDVNYFFGLSDRARVDLLGCMNGLGQVAAGRFRDVKAWARALTAEEVGYLASTFYAAGSLRSAPRGDLAPMSATPDAGVLAGLGRGLFARYEFAEGPGSRITRDTSNQGNDALVYGEPGWDTAARALRFTKDSQSLRPKAPLASRAATVSLWVFREPGATDWESLLSRLGGGYQHLLVNPATNKAGFWGRGGADGYREFKWHGTSPNNDAYLPYNRWTHVALVMDDKAYRLYLNRRKVVDADYFWGNDVGREVAILSTYNGAAHPFRGAVRGVQMWQRALSEAEVAHLYAFSSAIETPRGAGAEGFADAGQAAAASNSNLGSLQDAEPACRAVATEWKPHNAAWGTGDLSQHTARCGPGEKLAQFRVDTQPNPNRSRLSYTCCPTLSRADPIDTTTPWNEAGSGNLLYLERHRLACASGTGLQSVAFASNPAQGQLRMEGKCLPDDTGVCQPMATEWGPEGPGVDLLASHNVQCAPGDALSSVQLRRDLQGKMRVEYQCCKPQAAVVRWLEPSQQAAGGRTRVSGRAASYDRSQATYTDFGPQTFRFGAGGGFSVLARFRMTSPGNNEKVFDFGEDPGRNNLTMYRVGTTSDLAISLFGPDQPDRPFTVVVPGAIRGGEWVTVGARADRDVCQVILAGKTAMYQLRMRPELLTDRTLPQCYAGRSTWASDELLTGEIRMLSVYDYPIPLESLRKLVDVVATMD